MLNLRSLLTALCVVLAAAAPAIFIQPEPGPVNTAAVAFDNPNDTAKRQQ